MHLTLVDAILAVVILFGAWTGHRRGLLVAGLDLFTGLAALVLGLVFHPFPAAWLEGHWEALDPWLAPLSFIAVTLVAMALIGAIAHRIARLFPPQVHRHGLNRALGLVPGAANGAVHAVVLMLVFTSLPLFGGLAQYAREGALGQRLAGPADWITATLEPIFAPALRQVERLVTVPVGSKESVQLGFRVAQARPRPDLEARMLEMVNAERAKHGLAALAPRPELTKVARAHSGDMLRRGYFSHHAPDGQSLADRLRKDDVRFRLAGENLALAPDLATAHRGLMNSPGHRANILRPQFGHLGVGVLDAGRRGLMVTQNFSE